MILFAPLAIMLVGLLAFGITASNYYYGQSQQQGIGSLFKSILTGSYYLRLIGQAANRLFTKTLTNWMGQAAAQVDANVGSTFHYVASEIKAASDTMLGFSAFALTIAGAITGQTSWTDVQKAFRELRQELKADVHTADVALQRSIAQEKAAVRSVAQGVYPRLGSLERDVTKVIPKEIASARELAKDAADAAIHSAKWLKAHEKSLAATTFAGAVAWALGHLGLGWTRCQSNPFNNNPRACGLWSDLARFLPLLGFLTLAFDFKDFVKAAHTVADGIGTAVASIEGVFDVSLPPLPPPQL